MTSTNGNDNPIPPKGCTCGSLWSVRGTHGKKDCPYVTNGNAKVSNSLPLENANDGELDNILVPFFRKHLPWQEQLYDELKAAIESLLERRVLEGRINELELIDERGGATLRLADLKAELSQRGGEKE